MKKILGIAAAAGMLLVVAAPALAWYPMPTTTSTNTAFVYNNTGADAYTGGNDNVNTVFGKTGTVYNNSGTGNANATANTSITANTTVGCSTCGGWGGSNTMDTAFVTNNTGAGAGTGGNTNSNFVASPSNTCGWWGGCSAGSTVYNYSRTGNATSNAGSAIVVNTHWNK